MGEKNTFSNDAIAPSPHDENDMKRVKHVIVCLTVNPTNSPFLLASFMVFGRFGSICVTSSDKIAT